MYRLVIGTLWIASTLHATTLFWSSSAATPVPLALDHVFGISDAGIAVGSTGSFTTQQAAAVSIAQPNVIIPLTGVPVISCANGINASGQISGAYEVLSDGSEHAFVWSSGTGMQLLGNLGGNLSVALGINDAGQIVGQTLTAAHDLQAFVWSSGPGMVAVGDSTIYIAWDINSSGQTACQGTINRQHTAALCDGGSVTVLNLSPLNPISSRAVAINDSGWIVGVAVMQSSTQGFLWTPGGVTIFGSSFFPVDINNAGQVIGSYNGQPAVWTSGGGYQVLQGYQGLPIYLDGINNNGQIVGHTY